MTIRLVPNDSLAQGMLDYLAKNGHVSKTELGNFLIDGGAVPVKGDIVHECHVLMVRWQPLAGQLIPHVYLEQ